jgi:hypothetical protein
MLEDAISHGQFLDEPRPIRRRPPTVAIQKFKGNTKDYIRFKQAFKDAYEGVGLSEVTLAINLNEHLEGEPRSQMSHMVNNVDVDTYATMWTCMDKLYGTTDEMSTEMFLRFESMPNIKVLNSKAVSLLMTTLESNWAQLKEQSGNKFLKENNLHFTKFLQKLPLQEQEKYLDHCEYHGRKAVFQTFKEWLDKKWERLRKIPEQGKLDKALQYWHDDAPEAAAAKLLDDMAETQEELDMSDWQTVNMAADNESGQAYFTYQVPDGDDYGFYEFRNGKFNKIKKATFATKFPTRPNSGKPENRPQKALGFQKPLKPAGTCQHCKKVGHITHQCEAFKALSVKERYNSVKENKLCLRCLSSGHMAKECKVKWVCDVNKCGRRHHRLLHPEQLNKAMYLMFFKQGLESELDSDEERDNQQAQN